MIPRILASIVGASLAAFLLGQSLPIEPPRESGASVTGAFEGWFKNADGTFSLLLGYYNRNRKQDLDIPIGPNNRIDPGGPDRGQPTHFVTGRAWGMFTVTVPADFGDSKINWTIIANGKPTVIPASLKPDYEISPLLEASVGNTPPVISFEAKGASGQGPQGVTVERTAKMGQPFLLKLWASDDAKFTSASGAKPRDMSAPVTLRWTKYRGPGQVTFAPERPVVEKSAHPDEGAAFSGTATTNVTFSEPGDYMLHVTANDYSGEGGSGFQCCWTNGLMKVSVKP